MKENVGRTDQVMRAVIGPLLLGAGYAWLGGKEGKAGGLMTMIAGALVAETALTKTCPLNQVLGIDTTQPAAKPATSALFPGGAGGYGLRRAGAGRG
ncbi:MAG: DUF2892 domain-containing protein, partial [Desulfuromonadales bacterium]|nr:DUF2892 domain-containing protein [Desulfuromonadales bacterium]